MKMAKVKSAFLISLVVFGLANGGWEKVEGIPTNKQYRKVQFVDPQYGWVLQEDTRLDYSSDSGKTWTDGERMVSPYRNYVRINDFYFLDKNVGFVVGHCPGNNYTGSVYKTTDGGANWKVVFTDTSLTSVRKIVFPTSSPLVGYFFAQRDGFNPPTQKIMGRTTDGGETWVLEEEEMAGGEDINVITDVAFCNADTGWLVGTGRTGMNNTFLKTVDGGRSWEPKRYKWRSSPNNYYTRYIRTVFFSSCQVGYVGGNDNTLLYTLDGGDNWSTLMNASTGETITGVHVINDSLMWTITSTDRIIYFVKDSVNGESRADYWLGDVVRLDNNTTNLQSLFFIGSYGWIVGDNGTVYRTTNYGGLLESGSFIRQGQQGQIGQQTSFLNMRLLQTRKGISNISYTLNAESNLSISVYNLKGKKIASQPKHSRVAGDHTFSFKAPKGFYIVEAKVQDKPDMGERDAKHRVFTERFFVR